MDERVSLLVIFGYDITKGVRQSAGICRLKLPLNAALDFTIQPLL